MDQIDQLKLGELIRAYYYLSASSKIVLRVRAMEELADYVSSHKDEILQILSDHEEKQEKSNVKEKAR